METIEAIQRIIKEAEENNTQEMRVLKQHVVGKVAARHGDVYLHMVANDFPIGKEIDCAQIVDGNSIGSRHILTGDFRVYEGVNLPKYVSKQFFTVGKAFDVFDRAILTHPEHAHVSLVRGRYIVSHQIDMRTMQRVSD